MKLQIAFTLLSLAFLDSFSWSAGDEATVPEADKRRGWGKRSPNDLLDDMDKRRGWGKRADAGSDSDSDMDKRRGWGKRDPIDALASEEEVDKRRGWGKRSSAGIDTEVDKRRGWGKRSDLSEEVVGKRRGWGKRSDGDSLMAKRRGWGKRAEALEEEFEKRRGWGKRSAETDSEMEKRRGWGKRSFDDLETEMDKRRGWGKRFSLGEEEGDMEKRRGWGKRSENELELEEGGRDRRGWGKRGWGKRSLEESCEALRQDVVTYTKLAIEREKKSSVYVARRDQKPPPHMELRVRHPVDQYKKVFFSGDGDILNIKDEKFDAVYVKYLDVNVIQIVKKADVYQMLFLVKTL